MKVIMVERVSNADRARYTLPASPNARKRPDHYDLSSTRMPYKRFFRGQLRVPVPPFSEGGPNQWGGPNLSIAAAALDVIGPNGPFNLATTGKNNSRDPAKMLDAVQTSVTRYGRRSMNRGFMMRIYSNTAIQKIVNPIQSERFQAPAK